MPGNLNTITSILKGAGKPLSIDEILLRAQGLGSPVGGKNPKHTVRQTLASQPLYPLAGPSRYVYLPAVLSGSNFRLPLDSADRENRRWAVGMEVSAALWPGAHHNSSISNPALSLSGGPTVIPETADSIAETIRLLRLPEEFWDWLEGVRKTGADALILRCFDGEQARFAVEPSSLVERDAPAVAERNREIIQTAQGILHRSPSMDIADFTSRLLATGIYSAEPQPDPLAEVLFEQDGRFHLEDGYSVSYRKELTPALRRLFEDRLWAERTAVAALRGEPIESEFDLLIQPRPRHRPKARPAERRYRLKVMLAWDREVWRLIDILDNQTLEDLHEAIQRAFGWDDDHLYAFFLNGKRWDHLTAIFCQDDSDPPFVDEVRLSELGMEIGQRFLYLFDFGDELEHVVELADILPVPGERKFPRIVDRHGKAPDQYPDYGDH